MEELCFDLGKSGNAARFKTAPDDFIAPYRLAPEEAAAVKSGDIEALYRMEILSPAISSLCRVLGMDNVTYVRRLRSAAGLPENKGQTLLRSRARVGGGHGFSCLGCLGVWVEPTALQPCPPTALRRAEPSEAYPPSPRLRRILSFLRARMGGLSPLRGGG